MARILAIITGGIFLIDCLLPPERAMGTVLCLMGLATVIVTLKEWPREENK